MNSRPLRKRRPDVEDAREFLEITRDFVSPKDVVREAISNAIDWGAAEIKIKVSEDRERPEEEMVIEFEDNGIGLNEERLHAFFSLGRSTQNASNTMPLEKIGYKGHGTKTYLNSRQVEVYSESRESTVYAIMDSPLHKLMRNEVPEYEYEVESKASEKTFTKIKISAYNMNQNKRDFDHNVLKDYVLWSTKFGSVEKEFKIAHNQNKVLLLQGLGSHEHERIEFGHVFPLENYNLNQLIENRPGDWTKVFVKRWGPWTKQVINNPGRHIDLVFYIEGDEAKGYNTMLRRRRRTPEYGMYKVEDRYGLWVCKDYIPVKRYNDWLGLGKRLETKFHAFVNCQDFRLTVLNKLQK